DHVCRVWRCKERDNSWVGITGESLAAIQRIRAYTDKVDSACELSRAKVIGIGPHPSLGIIAKITATANQNGPTVIGSSRIIRLRKRYTLQIRSGCSELGE